MGGKREKKEPRCDGGPLRADPRVGIDPSWVKKGTQSRKESDNGVIC